MLYQLSYLGRSHEGRKRPSERAGYSGVEGRCLPGFAFGYASGGPLREASGAVPRYPQLIDNINYSSSASSSRPGTM